MSFKGSRIVELECGDGSSLMKVANALSIRDVYCVDIDEMALKKALGRGVKVFQSRSKWRFFTFQRYSL
jgi:predicted RNA methylase